MMEGVNLTTIYCKHFVNVPMYPQYNMIIKIKKKIKKKKKKIKFCIAVASSASFALPVQLVL
jgi:hypothetical protein